MTSRAEKYKNYVAPFSPYIKSEDRSTKGDLYSFFILTVFFLLFNIFLSACRIMDICQIV